MFDDFNGDREDLDPTIIPYKKNNQIILRRSAPHGFWVMSLARGPIPIALEGSFTSRTQALDRLSLFLKEDINA
jgi:hypothetical protein